MSDSKTKKPTSNKTSSQARQLMNKTLEWLANEDNDQSLKRRAKLQQKQQK